MIKSMTGFGQSEAHDGGVGYRVQVRSVNSKFLKVHAKVDDRLSFYESEVEQAVKQFAARGTVYVTIECVLPERQTEYEFNLSALRAYHSALEKIHRELGSDDEVRILELVNLPGVLQQAISAVGDVDRARDQLNALLTQAAAAMQQMRVTEGANLRAEIQTRCARLRELLKAVRAQAPKAVADYRDRLTKRIAEMLSPTGVNVDNQDFYREVAIFAERSDVAEEVARLESHIDQLLSSMESPEPVGRRLEFIAQEMFREANTMASKANDSGIIQTMVDVKGEVDRIREQVLNVE